MRRTDGPREQANHARRDRRRVLALGTCALALAYGAMKVILAVRGEVGMPGFPPSDRAPTDGVMARQLGNAAFGFLAAVIALLPFAPALRRFPTWLRSAPHWLGGLAVLAGAGGLALRALGLRARLGPPPTGLLGPLVAVLGLAWAGPWLALAWMVLRQHDR